MDAGHILYALALQADARLTETIKSRTGRTRWTMHRADERIPEIASALQAKYTADENWLMYLRTRRASN